MALRSRDTGTGYAPLDAKLRVQSHAAVGDIREGLRRWRSWSYLSVENVKNRYRRTVFGPWWLTLQMVILIVGLPWGALLCTALYQNAAEYIDQTSRIRGANWPILKNVFRQ